MGKFFALFYFSRFYEKIYKTSNVLFKSDQYDSYKSFLCKADCFDIISLCLWVTTKKKEGRTVHKNMSFIFYTQEPQQYPSKNDDKPKPH